MEDTIYYLSESLRKEAIDLELFLKVTLEKANLNYIVPVRIVDMIQIVHYIFIYSAEYFLSLIPKAMLNF